MKTNESSLAVEVDLHALQQVVMFLFHKAQRHYKDTGKPANHIFRQVAKLAHSLNVAYVAMGIDPDSTIVTSKREYNELMAAFHVVYEGE